MSVAPKDSYKYEPPLIFGQNKSSIFRADLSTFILGPLCGSVWLTLMHIGFPPLFNLFVTAVICTLFYYRDDVSFQLFIQSLTNFIVYVFFKDVQSRNAYKIPKEGPVIFICAPHANQFLDPAVVMQFVDRPVQFLCAAKSYRDKIVGALARGQCSIPVERPQDLAVSCPGTITIQGTTIHGKGTEFTKLDKTGSIFVAGELLKIQSIISDTELIVREAHTCPERVVDSKFKLAPKIDQHQVFRHVWSALHAGQCVGIFPEGGSHDRTELLPLKAGVAIMALGAAATYPGLNVKLIAVGLNYFQGHRFRGRAFVEYGDPFMLPQELIDLYAQGGESKIIACNTLLEQIKDQLRTVTVNAPSWDKLMMLWAVRRLYQPSGIKLPPKLAVILIRRFADGYEHVKHLPVVQAMETKVKEYNHTLRTYGLRDHQIPVTCLSRSAAFVKLVSRFTRLVIMAIFAFPGFILNFPILVTTRIISKKKADEALKSSTVKVAAKDVLASWKVIISLSLVPLVLVVYPSLAALFGYIFDLPMLHTWGNFAVLQPFMMWAAVRSTESFLDIARSIKPLYLAVIDRKGSKIAEIRKVRTELKTQIRQLVNTLGPQIYGPQFENLRIFSHGRLYQDTDGTGSSSSSSSSTDSTSSTELLESLQATTTGLLDDSKLVGGGTTGTNTGADAMSDAMSTHSDDLLRQRKRPITAIGTGTGTSADTKEQDGSSSNTTTSTSITPEGEESSVHDISMVSDSGMGSEMGVKSDMDSAYGLDTENMGDATDAASHRYEEEREIKLSQDILRKLKVLDAQSAAEFDATLNSVALAPLEQDAMSVTSDFSHIHATTPINSTSNTMNTDTNTDTNTSTPPPSNNPE